jgi:predicted amidophosphoribosyltransferase
VRLHLLDLVPSGVLVRPCAGCRGPGGPWCPACAGGLAGPVGRAALHPHPVGLPPVHAVAAYSGPVREALVAFKDHRRWLLREPLGRALARSVAAALAEPVPDERARPVTRVALVPVPGSPGSARLRDGDHVRELARVAARALAREAGVAAVVAPALVSVRRRRDQVGLDQRARRANLAASMAADPARLHELAAAATRESRPGLAVVVVDDLVTTGSTLAEAVRALTAAGVDVGSAAVVAARELEIARTSYAS